MTSFARRARKVSCAVVVVMAVLASACAEPAPPTWAHPTPEQWRAACDALGRLRAGAPDHAWVANIATTLHARAAGRTVDGRGAIAVAPGRAVRMILLAAAGATLLDAWVTEDRWRVAVPPLNVVRRGGADEPAGLPVGFLRWWFLSPFAGTLLAAAVGPERGVWLLRDGAAMLDVRLGPCERGSGVSVRRRSSAHEERIDECGASASPREPEPGDRVAYVDETAGLRVTIAVESVGGTPPDPRAFDDPDGPGGGT